MEAAVHPPTSLGVYVGPTKLEIQSVNTSLMIRAFRNGTSPRKKEWKELGKPATA